MKRVFFLLVVLAVLLAGCTTFKATGIAAPVPGDSTTVVGKFHTTIWVNGFLGASAGAKLFNVTADVTDGAIRDAIDKAVSDKGGTSAVDITIEHRASFLDLLLNGLTWFIWAPAEIEISGTIIK